MTRYDCLFVDLDGVVYRGPHAVVHAVDALNAFDGRVVYDQQRQPYPAGGRRATVQLRVGGPA